MRKFSYRVDRKATMELIEELNNNDNIYFRFHEPNIRMTYKSKSWGMIYSSAKEAEANDSEVLEGKSCTDTIEELMQWAHHYDNNYVVIAFVGDYIGVGSDGECVCKYKGKVAVFEYEDFVDFYNNIYKKNLYLKLLKEYNDTKPELRRFKNWRTLEKLEREFSC